MRDLRKVARKTCRKCGEMLFPKEYRFGECEPNEDCSIRFALRRKSRALRVAKRALGIISRNFDTSCHADDALAEIRRAERK